MTDDPKQRVANGERLLTLSEAAEMLHMKRSNTGKFLARRDVNPAFPKAQGYFYWETDIKRVKAEREADEARMAADARRRSSAQARARGEVAAEPPPPELARLGETQRTVLSELLRKPLTASEVDRFAVRRLRQRGLVEEVVTSDQVPVRLVQLTGPGRRLAGWL